MENAKKSSKAASTAYSIMWIVGSISMMMAAGAADGESIGTCMACVAVFLGCVIIGKAIRSRYAIKEDKIK